MGVCVCMFDVYVCVCMYVLTDQHAFVVFHGNIVGYARAGVGCSLGYLDKNHILGHADQRHQREVRLTKLHRCYTYVHTHIHSYTQTHIHIRIYTHTRIHRHIHIHTHTLIRIHTYTYTHTRIQIHTYTHTKTPTAPSRADQIATHTRTYIHTYIHTRTHMHTYTYTHTLICTYTHTHVHTYKNANGTSGRSG